jgi:hypothetical protein
MKGSKRILLYSLFILATFGSHALKAQTDTIQYLFMGHPRSDDKDHQYVNKTVEKLDYSKFELLLLGGDLTWNTSGQISTLEYCDSIFHLGDTNTHLAIGNHDIDNIASLLSYTQKDRYYSFSRNNLTFIVLDTELTTPDVSGSQLDLIKAVADTIINSDYLMLIHHRILWMADNPDLAHLIDSVAASSKNLGSSNFFDQVYPELQKVKNKGIPVYCIAGDRTDINIEYSIEDSIQFIASGMVGTFPDSNNFVVVFTHIPQEHILNYEFVPLSEMDTIAESPVQPTGYINNFAIDFNIYPNPCSDKIMVRLNEPEHDDMKTEIFSPQGIKIFEADIPKNKNSLTINMASLHQGLYYIRIGNNYRSLTKKIILFDNILTR